MPFSASTDTGTVAWIRGIELIPLSVPLHKVTLVSDLVQGEFAMGVRPSLPMEGVDIILGNDLAGVRVWKDVLPPLVVTSSPHCSEKPDKCAMHYPQVFSSCAVTRAMSKALSWWGGVRTIWVSPALAFTGRVNL